VCPCHGLLVAITIPLCWARAKGVPRAVGPVGERGKYRV
jgi:hypothetical protein